METLAATIITLEVYAKMLYGETLDELEMYQISSRAQNKVHSRILVHLLMLIHIIILYFAFVNK